MSSKKKITSHAFLIEDAESHGVNKAIVLYNLRYWLEYHRAHKKNINDGYVWTYCSCTAMAEIMPYFSSKSISRWLTELETSRVIKSGNYNKTSYDRTKWYTIINEYSISQSEESKPQTEETIPDVIPDVIPDKDKIDKSVPESIPPDEQIYQMYPRHKSKGAALKAINKVLKKKSFDFLMEATKAFAESQDGRTDRQFIPYPASWFNQECYYDDRVEWSSWRTGGSSPASDDLFTQPKEPEFVFNAHEQKLLFEAERAAKEKQEREQNNTEEK